MWVCPLERTHCLVARPVPRSRRRRDPGFPRESGSRRVARPLLFDVSVMTRQTSKRFGVLGPLALAVAALLGVYERPVRAEGEDDAARRERCATRLSIALVGRSATPDLTAAGNPQERVDELLADPAFVERFARYANHELNPEPGQNAAEDATYTLASYVLAQKKPWKEMFVGAYDVAETVTPRADGLGYFRSAAWMKRYAGNEEDGYRLVAAYRILQNTTGLQLTATTNVPGADLSAAGRANAACAGCHYGSWFALDKVARVLSRRQGLGKNMTFLPPTDGPQEILGGKTIADDAALVNALVASPSFQVNACRLAFRFLYARNESACEAAVFDRCMDAFAADGTMQSAVSVIAKDASFCQ